MVMMIIIIIVLLIIIIIILASFICTNDVNKMLEKGKHAGNKGRLEGLYKSSPSFQHSNNKIQ